VNCQDFNHVMDAAASADLGSAQREEMERHRSTCRACSEEWDNWRAMAGLAVPALPAALSGRIATALGVQQAQPPRRALRPMILGSLAVAGFAAAAGAVWLLARTGSYLVAAPDDPSGQVMPVAGADGTSIEPQVPTLREAASHEPAAQVDQPAGIAEASPADPRRLLVLVRPEAGADPQAIMLVSLCHDALVGRLRDIGPLDIIADGAITIRGGPDRYGLAQADRELARARRRACAGDDD
jgi:hypothetical protein